MQQTDYSEDIRKICYRFWKNNRRAGLDLEDYLQEAQIAEIKALKNYNPEKGPYKNYLLRLVYNKCIDLSRDNPSLVNTNICSEEGFYTPNSDFAHDQNDLFFDRNRQVVFLLESGIGRQQICNILEINTHKLRQIIAGVGDRLTQYVES